jgi:hypothetical protein
MTPEEAAKFLESDKLFLDPHELRCWVCPICKQPCVRLSPFNREGQLLCFLWAGLWAGTHALPAGEDRGRRAGGRDKGM